MPDLSIFKLDSETITIKDTTARQTAESAKTLATTASGNATTALNKINELESEKADTIISSTSGAIASFPDGADNIPMKDVLVHIEPVQAGSGDPSPDNVRPITGWTGAKVTRCGKNLWTFNSSYSSTAYAAFLDRVPFYLKAGTYTFSAIPNIESDSAVLFGYHADGTRSELGRLLASTSKQSSTRTISKDVVSLYFISNQGGTISDIQLELGPTASDFEPYAGNTYDITLPTEAGTVYGGYVDVIQGKLVVDKGFITFDGSNDETWYLNSGTYWIEVSGKRVGFKTSITNEFKNVDWAWAVTGYGIYGDHNILNRIYFKPPYSGFTETVEEWITWLASNPLQLCYELATPITYHLTPQEVRTLLGQNNVWSDAGGVSVTYRADTKLYIDNKIAELQALILENLEGETDHN